MASNIRPVPNHFPALKHHEGDGGRTHRLAIGGRVDVQRHDVAAIEV